jgi:2-methylisocitrate lyase-like PEP mutase family enzyme
VIEEVQMAQSVSKTSRAKRLRALINAPDILVLPGVFDGFSTRLVERMGYTAAFITGSGVSESRLGQPNVGLMGLQENVAAASDAASRANKFAPTTLHAATRAGNAVNV